MLGHTHVCVWLPWQSQLAGQGDNARIRMVSLSILLCETFYQHSMVSDTMFSDLGFHFLETEHLFLYLIVIPNLLFAKHISFLVSFSLAHWIASDCPFLETLFIHEYS